jgi:hypothetical protein
MLPRVERARELAFATDPFMAKFDTDATAALVSLEGGVAETAD